MVDPQGVSGCPHRAGLATRSAPGGTGGLWSVRRYHAGMSGLTATAQGALIAGGAAVIGFAASAWNTSRTVRAARTAARDQRLWEKRSALYEDLVARLFAFDAKEGDRQQAGEYRAALMELDTAAQIYASRQVRASFDEVNYWLGLISLGASHQTRKRLQVDELRRSIRDLIRAEVQGKRRPD